MPLIRWSKYPADVWTLADAYQDVVVFGQKGSGKTSSSARLFATRYLRAGFSGLVLVAQPEETELWHGYLKATGREGDGRFFSLDGSFRFNALAWEAQQAGGADFSENVVNVLLDLAAVRKSEASGDNAAFWQPQRKKFLRNVVSLLMLAGEDVSLASLYRVMTSAPATLEEADNRNWKQDSFLFQVLTKAGHVNGNHPDLAMVRYYFLRELPKLHAKTRGIVEADITGVLDPLTRGKLADRFGTTTNLSPDDILEHGRVIVVDIPAVQYREIGQYAAMLWLQMVQRAAQRRAYQPPHSRPLFIMMDECHYFALPEQDSRFASTSRHHGVSVVRLTQGIPGIREAYGSQDGADGILSHAATQIFHANHCPVTNDWAAKSIGEEARVKHSLSRSDRGKDRSHQTSMSVVQDDSCPPRYFQDLRSGGHRHRGVVDCIVTQSGRQFLDGRRWIISSARQNRV